MKRILAWLAALLLPVSAMGEGWVRAPLSLMPDSWLTAQVTEEEAVLVAEVDTPEGFALLEALRFLAASGDEALSEVSYTAALAGAATATDLPDSFGYSAAGRSLTCGRDETGLSASFTAGDYVITLRLTPGDASMSTEELLRRLPELLAAVHVAGETSGMPLTGLVWGMEEDALTELLGVAVYAVPLAGEGWEGLEYVTALYGAEVAELDCCMKDGRLSMLLVGLEEESTDRLQALLTESLGEPAPADSGRLASCLALITGSGDAPDDALMWHSADADLFLTRMNGVVMLLLTDPTLA